MPISQSPFKSKGLPHHHSFHLPIQQGFPGHLAHLAAYSSFLLPLWDELTSTNTINHALSNPSQVMDLHPTQPCSRDPFPKSPASHDVQELLPLLRYSCSFLDSAWCFAWCSSKAVPMETTNGKHILEWERTDFMVYGSYLIVLRA